MAELRVEIPETLAESARGLAGRRSLGPGAGMLFDLRAMTRSRAGSMTFTTVGMLFPLDFLVVEGGVVSLVLGHVRPGVAQVFTAVADYVVEAPAGWARANSIGRGTTAVAPTWPL